MNIKVWNDVRRAALVTVRVIFHLICWLCKRPLVCVVGMVGSSSLTVQPPHKWRTKEILLIDFISLLESHVVFTQAEEHKAVTAASANSPRPIYANRLRWGMYVQDVHNGLNLILECYIVLFMSYSSRVCENERWRGSTGPVWGR